MITAIYGSILDNSGNQIALPISFQLVLYQICKQISIVNTSKRTIIKCQLMENCILCVLLFQVKLIEIKEILGVMHLNVYILPLSQPAITCSKPTMEISDHCVKSVQNQL